MRAARELFKQFLGNEEGATAIEYGLIAGLIAIAIVGGAASVGTATSGSFNKVSAGFTT